MRPDPVRLLLPLVTLASAAILWFGEDVPFALRWAVGIPFALLLPGLALAWPLSSDRSCPARLALVGGSSLAITVVTGLILNLAGALTPHGWALGLGTAIIVASTVAPRGAAPIPRGPRLKRAALWPALGVVVFGTLSASAIVLAQQGAEAHREFAFTEFWMVPDEGTGRRVVTLGVTNQEGVFARYEVDLVVDGGIVGQLPAVGVGPGESWSTRLTFPVAAKGVDRKVEAWLYRDGVRTNVYRKAWTWN